MDKETIERLANEACERMPIPDGTFGTNTVTGCFFIEQRPPLGYCERFAALIAEECAKVAENTPAAIRASGNARVIFESGMIVGRDGTDDAPTAIRRKFGTLR